MIAGFEDDYELDSPIGMGGTASIWKVWDRTTRRNGVLKVVYQTYFNNTPGTEFVDVNRESRLWERAKHRYIWPFISRRQDAVKTFFITEYCGAGDLRKYMFDNTRMPTEQIRHFAAQLLEAVEYLHDMGVVHCDIKDENILLKGDRRRPESLQIQLMDFGMAKEGNELKGCMGSPYWIAPEVARRKGYDSKIDIWAVGQVLLAMFVGRATPL
ncbi:hypothetical protein FRB95_013632 [Tulasnella sp. JGI-2019a]|nr:hypothetical protein FRB95_013632 [Tulasnella sp. JGI-2019a]